MWFMLALFALVNPMGALRYLLPHLPFPVEMENFTQRRLAPSLHALAGAIALLAGPLQFVSRFRPLLACHPQSWKLVALPGQPHFS
jgi:hypothetical protein